MSNKIVSDRVRTLPYTGLVQQGDAVGAPAVNNRKHCGPVHVKEQAIGPCDQEFIPLNLLVAVGGPAEEKPKCSGAR